jgi:rubrerythrin
MYGDHNPNLPDEPNNPFEDEYYLLPCEEEIRLRAEQVQRDNQHALRHFVDVLGWETFGYPEIRQFLIPLLWHSPDIDPSWVAEACCMSVRDVSEIAESQPLMTFNCLDCGRELPVSSRRHLLKLNRILKAFCTDQTNTLLNKLLCNKCSNIREKQAEDQQHTDQLRQQALIREYRKGSYAERRQTEEWGILKKQVFRRDGYRCRMCNRGDLPLHLHHRTYQTYAQEKLEDLITLCANCHGFFHSVAEVS